RCGVTYAARGRRDRGVRDGRVRGARARDRRGHAAVPPYGFARTVARTRFSIRNGVRARDGRKRLGTPDARSRCRGRARALGRGGRDDACRPTGLAMSARADRPMLGAWLARSHARPWLASARDDQLGVLRALAGLREILRRREAGEFSEFAIEM